MAPPQRLLPPGKPESLTQTRKGWTGSVLRQWNLFLTRVPLCAGAAPNG
jgi:hypothetical protein